MSCITVIQYFPSFLRNNVQKKTSPWKQEFFAQLAATMMYYEDTSLRFNLEHIF